MTEVSSDRPDYDGELFHLTLKAHAGHEPHPETEQSGLADAIIQAVRDANLDELSFRQRDYVQLVCSCLMTAIRIGDRDEEYVEFGAEYEDVKLRSKLLPTSRSGAWIGEAWGAYFSEMSTIPPRTAKDRIYLVETDLLDDPELLDIAELINRGWKVRIEAGEATIAPGYGMVVSFIHPEAWAHMTGDYERIVAVAAARSSEVERPASSSSIGPS